MNFSANQIGTLVNGIIEGDGNVTVSTFAKIEEGHPGAISFLANPKYTHYIYTTQSSIVLVRKDFVPEREIAATLIRVEDPYQTMTQLLEIVNEYLSAKPSGIEQPSYISEGVDLGEDIYIGAFAYIGNCAKIGKSVKIYPQAYIGNNVTIGDNTIIYPGVKIYHDCIIGNNVIIHAGAVIGADGFGFAPTKDGNYKKIPQIGNVVIGDNVEIGANTTIDRATMGHTKVGDGTKLDNLIQVAHNVEIGRNTVMASQVGIAGSTKVGSNCVFAGQVGVAGHIHIGNHVTIGAQSGIPNNVKDGVTIMGTPAINSKDWLRQTVYIKNLQNLYSEVKDLKSSVDEYKNK
jgi:UDP-3-O-[3-hydroxymyristoyl] glucosamine N-acyltransferase